MIQCYKAERAELGSYGKPYFPARLNTINQLYDILTFNGERIGSIGEKIDGFMYGKKEITSDGYLWFYSLHFDITNGSLVVVFPWCMGGKFNAVKIDRSMAVYLNGAIKETEIDVILEKIEDSLWDLFFECGFIYCMNRKIPSEIFGRVTKDGRKVVPKWYVDVRAYLNPVYGGEPVQSWIEAEKWFRNQGWAIQ